MPGSEGSMEENNLAPFSMKILLTLIQPFYTCIDVIKLKQDDGITNLFEMVKADEVRRLLKENGNNCRTE